MNRISPLKTANSSGHILTRLLIAVFIVVNLSAAQAQIITGASRFEVYLQELKGKKVAIVANPTSIVNGTHLVDTLLALGVKIEVVFAPEHGFRGEAEAGETVNSGVDVKTGVKVVSLYGSHKKPTNDDLKGVNQLVFDVQDVGVRFYTYISTLQYVMEACASLEIPVMVLDRPNPNGHFVDGPVLKKQYASFVGMQPIPVVHGMTMGEYASMLNGEGWLEDSLRCRLKVVQMKNWTHETDYSLPVPPSPNLPNDAAVRLYPSLCFFEGADVSVGRGTEYPFQCFGFPGNKTGDYKFTPMSIPGKAKNPPYLNQECIGKNLSKNATIKRYDKLHLEWLIEAYNSFAVKEKFFNAFFLKLAGIPELQQQIEAGLSADEIREGWKADLEKFKKIRSRYLLYP
jgi:uncharacterized protein YbbC (DUF1343 family)